MIYNYAAGNFSLILFHIECKSVGLSKPNFVSCDEQTPNIHITYDPPLDGTQKAILDGVMAAHDSTSLMSQKILLYSAMGSEVTSYVYEHYDEEAQSTLEALLGAANTNGKTNRAVYISPAMTWLESVLVEFYAKKAVIFGAANQAALDAVTWDFSTFDASDPLVTIESAIAITD